MRNISIYPDKLTLTNVGNEMVNKFSEVYIFTGFLVFSNITLIVALNFGDISIQLDSYRLNDNLFVLSAKRLPNKHGITNCNEQIMRYPAAQTNFETSSNG